MKTRHVRTLVIMAIASIMGILIMQAIWFKKAYDLKQRQFNHTVYLALQNVAEKILEYNKIQIPLNGLVSQISTNYYAVNIDSEIEASILEFILKTEFKKRNINIDFEYGIYNCGSGKMIYGNYISADSTNSHPKAKSELPLWKEDKYYFSVLFPTMTMNIASQMGIWLFFNGILIIVCMFFSYALLIILKQKRLSEVQKDFINNMTHELKTPLSTILVSAEIIKKPIIYGIPDQILSYAEIITRETVRLKAQVDKVLQVALLDKKAIDLKLEAINLHLCIQEVAKNAALLIAEKEGELVFHLDAQNCMVKADAIHLSNVFNNLIDNALKYCKNKPLIIIKSHNQKNKIIVQVIDNGLGISNDNIGKVFEKFYRVPTGNVHNIKGFGLGLYYVKTIIAALKGKIILKSEIGKGTEIHISLPLATSNN